MAKRDGGEAVLCLGAAGAASITSSAVPATLRLVGGVSTAQSKVAEFEGSASNHVTRFKGGASRPLDSGTSN